MREDPLHVLLDQLLDGVPELRLNLGVAVRLQDGGLRLDHLGERPVADALAVWQRSALAPVRQLPTAVDRLEQLPDEPALADAGDTDDRQQLRGALLANALQRADDLL